MAEGVIATEPSIDELFESALRLSSELRARLAQVLLSSLEGAPDTLAPPRGGMNDGDSARAAWS